MAFRISRRPPFPRDLASSGSRSCKLSPAMKTATLACLAVAIFTGCVTGVADPAQPGAVARIDLVKIEPAAGAALVQDTVLVADIHYSIENFQPRAHYYVAPQFASNDGVDQTFSAGHLLQSTRITSPTGTLTLRHSVAHELRSPQLARPIKLWFYVMERTGEQRTRVIGMTEPITYQ